MKTSPRRPAPFTFSGGKAGLLLLHGFTGTTAELLPLGRALNRCGYTVHAPLLAGHGKTPEELARTGWEDWWASAREGYQTLRAMGCDPIGAVGLSMGGLLALYLAVHETVAAVATLCAPVYVRDKRLWATGVLKYFLPYARRGRPKQPHIERELYVYEKVPLTCVDSLRRLMRVVRRCLPDVGVPVFIAQSGQDETVDPRSADVLYAEIGSVHKERVQYPQSTHIITLDVEKEQLFADLAAFFARWMPPAVGGHETNGRS
ncbi:MAG: alpha/beta fold hydrolase [Calditerricola sp.]|nr:alpha/beta fold hydrolase [Calditerricola sp.]